MEGHGQAAGEPDGEGPNRPTPNGTAPDWGSTGNWSARQAQTSSGEVARMKELRGEATWVRQAMRQFGPGQAVSNTRAFRGQEKGALHPPFPISPPPSSHQSS